MKNLWLSFSLLVAIGCRKSEPVAVSEIYGAYSIKYSHGSEQLVLRGDSTFIQTYTPISLGQSFTNQGRWQYNADGPSVYLADAMLFDSGANQKPAVPGRTGWVLQVLSSNRKIELQVNDQESLYFLKIRKSPPN